MLRHRLACLLLITALGASLSASPGTSPAAAQPVVPRDQCRLNSGPGINAQHVVIGNVSDLSGPVPGLHESTRAGVEAFVRYSHHTGIRVCGRTLLLLDYDSKTDAGADQRAYSSACTATFAVVGSESDFDSGGAESAQACGVPDLRVRSETAARRACHTCLAVDPADDRHFPNAIPDLLRKSYGGGQRAALLYVDSGAESARARAEAAAEAERGLRFVYVTGIATTEFNYLPFAQQLKDRHVETVEFPTSNAGAVDKLTSAMNQIGYHPTVLMLTPDLYTSSYDAHGITTVAYLDSQPFEATHPSRDLTLYLHWLQVVEPGAEPTVDGLYAWSATRLLVNQARALGSKLTRRALLRQLRTVHHWRDAYLHAPQDVGSGVTTDCLRFVQREGTSWVGIAGRTLHCDGLTAAS